jgi:transposase
VFEAERTIADLERAVAERDAQIAELERLLKDERYDNAMWRHKVETLLHRLHGRKSERLHAGQLSFCGEVVEAPPPGDAPADEATHETPPAKRRKGRGGRKPLPKDLPRQRVVHEVPEGERTCPCCQKPMEPFGEDVTEQLDYVPAKLLVLEHVRPKYACKTCQEGVKQASLPARPIEKGRPGAGLLAHILVSKFVDHLPLYRQAKIFERFGIDLPRSTLCDWAAVVAEELEPVVQELRKAVLASKVVQADETTLLVLEDHNGKRRRQCYLWVYRALSGETVFEFRPTRSGDGPREFLRDFQGYLQHDGYQGYEGLGPTIVDVGCWAHVRRGVFEARLSSPAEADAALSLIGKLYKVEREAKDLPPADRAALRRERAVHVLEEIHARFTAWQAEALPRSDFGKAVAYALRRWPSLVRYVEDGDLQIDNNSVERAIRPAAIGRKNYQFAGSYQGGHRAAVFYSLVESCRAAGVEPFAYFVDVLMRTTTATPRELTPAAWKAAREAIHADIPS